MPAERMRLSVWPVTSAAGLAWLTMLCLAWLLLWVPAAWAGPQIESWKTQGGAKVMYVHAPDLPMVDVRVVFDAGSARDDGVPGLSRFTNALLEEGAGEWDADALALRLEERGIELGAGSLRDMAWVSVRSLVDPVVLEVALDSLAAVLAKPRLDTDAVERVRQQMLIGLRRSLQSPGTVAQRRFFQALYLDHPYAHPPDGEVASLQRIDRDALAAFHHRYYVAANAVVAIVGAVGRDQAELIADRVTAGLAAGEKASALPPAPATAGVELRESFPSSQTHIYVGQGGISRHDPDYFPLYVGNHVLGGGSLVSLLGEEVRNKRGLSYSVYSYFSPMRVDGPFLMVAQTKNDQAGQALAVMRETLSDFISKGPDADELERAKQNLIGGFPLRIASNAKIVEYLAMMGFYDYPLDHLDTLTTRIAAVDAEQVRDAFARRLRPDGGIAVIVGGG
jgi:zinc protease